MQWEYLSGAATRSIVDNADILEVDNAKNDSRRRRSIRMSDQLVWDPSILSTKIGDEAPHLQEWIEQA